MKKIFFTIITLIVFSSCSEENLEAFTPGVITDESLVVVSSTNVQQLLHDGLNTLTNRDEFVFTSIFTDEAAPGSNNGGQGVSGTTNYYNFQLESLSPIAANVWNSNYNACATFNFILRDIDQLIAKKLALNETTEVNILRRQKAEALVLRAFAHTKILAYFSTNLTDDNALAGIIAKERYPYDVKLPRAKNSDYYAFVHKDLDDAILIFTSLQVPPSVLPTHNPIYPGVRLANALKARLYAYKKDYINAETFANNVITTSGINIATSGQLASVFHTHTSSATTEVIFKLRRTVQQNAQGTNLHNGWVSVSNARNGSPFYEVSRGLFNVLNPTNAPVANDLRAYNVTRPQGGTTGSLVDLNYATSTTPLTSDILVPFKHGGSSALTAANRFNPDFIQMRISEMHFIVAEARAYADDYTGVANALKNITDRRFTTPPALLTLTSRPQALRAILDERRKELCFEGHRYIDLKRLAADAGVTSFDRHPIDYNGLGFPGANPANFPFANNTRWALPIPQSETNANINCLQNPGY